MDSKKYWDEMVPNWVKDGIAKGDVVKVEPQPGVTIDLTEDEANLVLRCIRKLRHDPMFEEDDQDKLTDVMEILLAELEFNYRNREAK